jgi:hypothetical protein
VHIERDLKYIDDAVEKMKSDITKNISDIDKQKRKFLSDISHMRKLLNNHLDQIEKQTVEESYESSSRIRTYWHVWCICS